VTRLPTTRVRYFVNALNLVRRQEGWSSAAVAAVDLSRNELRRVPRLLLSTRRDERQAPAPAREFDVPTILQQLDEAGIDIEVFTLERTAFEEHMLAFRYPRFYAGGPIAKGGFRESKILEYFISIDLLPVAASDVVIDVASERSVFPEMINATVGAQVFRQDLIYPPGVDGDKIGGSAAAMPVPAGFADKIFLHNSFEHFEGVIDTEFVTEAWRLLKPGGGVCIVPLFLSTRYQIVTDPLVDTKDVVWDPDAEVVPRKGYRSRFGRFYSARALATRVLEPAAECGFQTEIYRLGGVDPEAVDPISRGYKGIRFAMVLRKPSGGD
jgi:SAM-dependent methyltransferase